MKTFILQEPELAEDYAQIHCAKKTREILELAAMMEGCTFYLIGKNDKTEKRIHVRDIFYFESVDKKTFCCLAGEVWEIPLPLREIEAQTARIGFVRISKSVIVNLNRVAQIRSDLEMRMLLLLENGEQLIASRHYRRQVREGIQNLKTIWTGGRHETDQPN